jgi:predicted ATPase
MVEEVAARKAMSEETIATVIERTGGVPLYVEELTRAVLENGGAGLTGRKIPVTLHDSLMARLDRLGPAKEIIQIGAVIGSEFSYELLHAVHPIPDEDLQDAILSATDAELVYVRGIPPDAAYQFKHVLIRDAAYEALLRSRRKELHSRIAEVLVQQFPDRMTSAPELLAHHYSEAGLIEQAIPYWQRAGQRAIERSANREAISHFTKGLELLKSASDSPERAQQELMLQLALGTPLMVVRGYAAPEVERVYARARELCQQVSETPQLFPVLFGLWQFYLVRAELQTAHELGEQLLSLARTAQDPALLLEVHRALGQSLFHLGEAGGARAHFDQAMALYDPHQHRSHAFLYGSDPGVTCLSYAPMALWLLGYPEQALERSHAALTLAHKLAHPYSLAFALGLAAVLHHLRREGPAAQEQAEAAMTLAAEHGFVQWLAHGTILKGWALAEQGQGEGELAHLQRSLVAWRATGAEVVVPYFLVLLAEAYGTLGHAEEGMTALSEGLAVMDRTGERWHEAELYRLKGDLTLQLGGNSGHCNPQHGALASQSETEAEACFRRAIEIARQQGAKSWELHATTSLARLLTQQGRRDESRSMLAEIYGWFTEGFDTADLKDAKALLEELGA